MGFLTGFTVPGMNSILQSSPQVQAESGWLPVGASGLWVGAVICRFIAGEDCRSLSFGHRENWVTYVTNQFTVESALASHAVVRGSGIPARKYMGQED